MDVLLYSFPSEKQTRPLKKRYTVCTVEEQARLVDRRGWINISMSAGVVLQIVDYATSSRNNSYHLLVWGYTSGSALEGSLAEWQILENIRDQRIDRLGHNGPNIIRSVKRP